jgi:hypothetical protein
MQKGDSADTTNPPTLTVVGGNPDHTFVPSRRRRSDDKTAIILPPIDMFDQEKWQFECRKLGVANWQRNRAWQIFCRLENKDKYPLYSEAFNRVFLLWQALGLALEWERREILAILQENHPARAQRIMKELQRQEPKPRRKRGK